METYDKTTVEVDRGFCLRPHTSEEEVSAVMQTETWVFMSRFPVVHGDKARPVDDGSAHANGFSAIIEHLTVPTMDIIISMVRALKQATGESLGQEERVQAVAHLAQGQAAVGHRVGEPRHLGSLLFRNYRAPFRVDPS